MVLLFGTLASVPPPPLQDLQPIILMQLEDGLCNLFSEWRSWQETRRQDKSQPWKGAAQGSGAILVKEKNEHEMIADLEVKDRELLHPALKWIQVILW